MLGGWLHVTFGWRSTFVFLALFGVLMLLVSFLLIFLVNWLQSVTRRRLGYV